jgi:hypothetical protein
MYEYENLRRVAYGEEGVTFIPVCQTCCRFVKADPMIKINETGLIPEDNATCSKCGRTKMIFEGFV